MLNDTSVKKVSNYSLYLPDAFRVLVLLYLLSISTLTNAKTTLKVHSLVTGGTARQAYIKMFKEFETQNPNIEIKFFAYSDADYKDNLDKLLLSDDAADILYWQSGKYFSSLARRNMIKPLSHLWKKNKWDAQFNMLTKDLVSVDDTVYAIPVFYYYWGFYYNQKLFQRLNINPPDTWDQFIAVCEILKSNGAHPIILGTKNHWPAASWFDYLNLRINGLEFHRGLLNGDVSFTDQRVVSVFKKWKALLDKGYFFPESSKFDRMRTLPYLYREKAAMMLMGNFILPEINTKNIDKINFFRFPIIDNDMPIYEEMPLDLFTISARTQNLEAAEKFITFLARAKTQSRLNQALKTLPANLHAYKMIKENRFLKKGYQALKNSAGYSQYYNRDSHKALSTRSFKALSKFMGHSDINIVIKELEKIRIEYLDKNIPTNSSQNPIL